MLKPGLQSSVIPLKYFCASIAYHFAIRLWFCQLFCYYQICRLYLVKKLFEIVSGIKKVFIPKSKSPLFMTVCMETFFINIDNYSNLSQICFFLYCMLSHTAVLYYSDVNIWVSICMYNCVIKCPKKILTLLKIVINWFKKKW